MIYVSLQAGPSNAQQRNTSTWSNVLSKVKLMVPYVWPKGSFGLQAVVIMCLLILGVGRVLNVFVPLYSKYIGKELKRMLFSLVDKAQCSSLKKGKKLIFICSISWICYFMYFDGNFFFSNDELCY